VRKISVEQQINLEFFVGLGKTLTEVLKLQEVYPREQRHISLTFD